MEQHTTRFFAHLLNTYHHMRVKETKKNIKKVTMSLFFERKIRLYANAVCTLSSLSKRNRIESVVLFFETCRPRIHYCHLGKHLFSKT